MESFEARAPLVFSYLPFTKSESKGKTFLYNIKNKECRLSHSDVMGKHMFFQ